MAEEAEKGWIGVDFDGTLAFYDEWRGPMHTGPAIRPMLERVRQWLSEGKRVKIFSCRGNDEEGRAAVHMWLVEHGLPKLEVTCTKDWYMIELWDDRCVQLKPNTGKRVDGN